MNYNPKRDIPKAVKELKTLSPSKIVLWVREHRTEIDKKSGRKIQKNINPEAITNYFRRHPELKQKLVRELHLEEIPKQVHSDALFENGTFREIPEIKNWIIKLRARGAKEVSINKFVNAIKQICMGTLPHKQHIKDWGLKHPARLNMDDALLYLSEIQKRGLRSRRHKLSLRNFFKFRGVENWDEISGELEEAGKYADLYVSKDKIYQILEHVKALNYDAYLASFFAYKTGARLTATLNADTAYINEEEHRITLKEKASTHKAKRRIVKHLSNDLWELLKPRIHREGKLFRITKEELNWILRSAYQKVIPQLNKRVPMPFHFWRHMFAQHMLRANNWNQTLVGKLGGWTPEALRRYYGKMPFETAVQLGKDSLNNL